MYRTSKLVTNFRIPGFSVLICLKNNIGSIELHTKKFLDLYLNESLGKVFKISIQKKYLSSTIDTKLLISYKYKIILFGLPVLLLRKIMILQLSQLWTFMVHVNICRYSLHFLPSGFSFCCSYRLATPSKLVIIYFLNY